MSFECFLPIPPEIIKKVKVAGDKSNTSCNEVWWTNHPQFTLMWQAQIAG